MRQRPRVSLTFKVFSITGISLMISMSALSYISYLQNSARTMDSLSNEFDIVYERLRETLLEPLWGVSLVQVDKIIQLEMQNENVLAIIVHGEDGSAKTNFGYSKDIDNSLVPITIEKEKRLKRTAFKSLENSIIYQDIELGSISLYYTDVPTKKRLAQEFFDLLLRTILVTSITLTLSFLYFRISILSPIFVLTGLVEQFGKGNWSIRTRIRRNDEIGALSVGFNEMADRLEMNERTLEKTVSERTAQLVESEKFAFLGTLVAGVAHEINTPIGIGITAVTYQLAESERIVHQFNENNLKKSDLDKYLQDSLESSRIIEANLVRAGAFIQSFKLIAVDQSTEDQRRFRVKEYLEEIIFALRPKLKKTKHVVLIECDENLEVLSYPGALSQIITNLIVNSLVHGLSPDTKGTITIKVDSEYTPLSGSRLKWLVVKYSDDGKGISPENLKKIFTPFFTTLKGSGGTGLGLYIIQRTAASIGGTISCESDFGKGVCFTIRFPVEILE